MYHQERMQKRWALILLALVAVAILMFATLKDRRFLQHCLREGFAFQECDFDFPLYYKIRLPYTEFQQKYRFSGYYWQTNDCIRESIDVVEVAATKAINIGIRFLKNYDTSDESSLSAFKSKYKDKKIGILVVNDRYPLIIPNSKNELVLPISTATQGDEMPSSCKNVTVDDLIKQGLYPTLFAFDQAYTDDGTGEIRVKMLTSAGFVEDPSATVYAIGGVQGETRTIPIKPQEEATTWVLEPQSPEAREVFIPKPIETQDPPPEDADNLLLTIRVFPKT